MELNKKNTWYIPFLYGFVVFVANSIGSKIPVASSINFEAQNFSNYQNLVSQHRLAVSIVTSFCYIIPIVLCCCYALTINEKNVRKRFINLPIAYATISISGWIYYYLAEIISLLISKKYLYITIKNILLVSSMYIFLECLFSFTLGFFIMETLHRKVFLPRFFPDGKIAATPGLIKPSNRFLFTVFYISVSVFPISFISFAYFTSISSKLDESDIRFIVFLIIIVVLDIVILITFQQYYSSPLKTQAKYSELSEKFCNDIIKAAPMHDLGKIAVPDAILQKPGKFTDEEYEKMKMHSAEGARIVGEVLKEVDDEYFKKLAINVAHYHHEKWNGQGYPEKLAGEQIPFEARVMALADVFDALVSKRCYKDSFSYEKAFEIISQSGGSHFDPELTKEFIKCRNELEDLYNRLT